MIDSDPHKQGKLFMGIPIVTFKQALASKPDLSVSETPLECFAAALQ